jgi:hypothetical protein
MVYKAEMIIQEQRQQVKDDDTGSTPPLAGVCGSTVVVGEIPLTD